MNIEMVKNLINREDELKSKGISIIKKYDYTRFYYNMIEANFYDEETCYCRGITFKGDKVVCCPFFKFGNYGEGYVPEIDWASAKVKEKIDGSLIMVWFDSGRWHVSTSKNIDAFDAPVGEVQGITFGGLFIGAATAQGLNLGKLNTSYTYMFELVSPYNKVVVPYDKIEIWHIGTRDNETLQEVEVDIGIQQPKEYPLSSLEDCITAAAAFQGDKEGFVVVDKNYNRVKIKSPFYVQLHHAHNNGNLSKENILSLIFNNEQGEYLNYFPEKAPIIHTYENKLRFLENALESELQQHENWLKEQDRKTAARFILDMFTIPDYAFTCIYKQKISALDYLKNMSAKNCLKILEQLGGAEIVHD